MIVKLITLFSHGLMKMIVKISTILFKIELKLEVLLLNTERFIVNYRLGNKAEGYLYDRLGEIDSDINNIKMEIRKL